jgi:hypothetical protein
MPPGNEAQARAIVFRWVSKPPTLYGVESAGTEPARAAARPYSAPVSVDEVGVAPERIGHGTEAPVGLPPESRLFALLAVVSAVGAFLALQALGGDVLPSTPAVVDGSRQDVIVAAESSELRERALLAKVKRHWAGGATDSPLTSAKGTGMRGGHEDTSQDTQAEPPPPRGDDESSGSNNVTLPIVGETPVEEPELPVPVPDPGLPEDPLSEPPLPEL